MNLERVFENMKYENKTKSYFFSPVIALGINSNLKVIENEVFNTKDEAFARAKEIVEGGYLLPVGFQAKEKGVVSVLVESMSGYSDGPFESKVKSSVIWDLN